MHAAIAMTLGAAGLTMAFNVSLSVASFSKKRAVSDFAGGIIGSLITAWLWYAAVWILFFDRIQLLSPLTCRYLVTCSPKCPRIWESLFWFCSGPQRWIIRSWSFPLRTAVMGRTMASMRASDMA